MAVQNINNNYVVENSTTKVLEIPFWIIKDSKEWEEVLFTTEDGVDLYGGETVYFACKNYEGRPSTWKCTLFNKENVQRVESRNTNLHQLSYGSTEIKVFSTKELAEKFIKPEIIFTTHDGVQITKLNTTFYVVKKEPLAYHSAKRVENINIKHRIWDGSDGFLQFSTEKAAQKYIMYNKPCLTLQEAMGAVSNDLVKSEKRLLDIVKKKLK